MGSGCALLPQFGEPPQAEPPIVEADTTRVRVPDPDLWPTATEDPVLPTETTEQTARRSTPKAPPPTPPDLPTEVPESASSDSLGAGTAPAVTVSPPRKALEELETETLAALEEARRLIHTVNSDTLDSEGQDRLRIVRGFITQAEEALTRQDLQAAAGLARKARLLALELTSR